MFFVQQWAFTDALCRGRCPHRPVSAAAGATSSRGGFGACENFLILRKKQTGTIAGLGLIAVDRQVLPKLAAVIAQGMAAAVERGICTADKPFAVAIREDLVERAVYHVLDGNALDHGHHGVAVAEDKVDAVARRVERQLDHAEGERKRIHQRAFFQKGLRRFVAALGRERHQLLTEQLVLSQVALAALERAAVGHGIDAGPADVDDLILSDGDALCRC